MNNSPFGQLSGSVAESKQRAAENKLQRKEAAESPNSIIIGRNDLDGQYDSSRMLETTLGGKSRPITPADLVAFKRNVATAQEKFKGGISAQQVIDLSIKDARDRASSQINMVVPSLGGNNLVRFITNASKDSKKTRHFVNVQFMSFDAGMQSSMEPRQAVNWIRKQPLIPYHEPHNFLRNFSLGLLLFVAVLTFVRAEPIFCQWLCPLKMTTGFMGPERPAWITQLVIMLTLGVLLLIALPIIFRKRIFCGLFCLYTIFF